MSSEFKVQYITPPPPNLQLMTETVRRKVLTTGVPRSGYQVCSSFRDKEVTISEFVCGDPSLITGSEVPVSDLGRPGEVGTESLE